jgi:hypothetical protein
MKNSYLLALLALSQFCAPAAFAWSRAGHMLTAAIVYDDLSAKDRKIIEEIATLMEKHPDRGPFSVAIGTARGEERNRRLFMEMARWADDMRGGVYDHPTWHYTSAAIADKGSPSGKQPRRPEGSAVEAFVLSFNVASDKKAPPFERAVALCWIFHLVGDLHQPLHSASMVSSRFPDGDRGGGLQFVRDPADNEPMSLHSYWDELPQRSEERDHVRKHAAELETRLPRTQFPELRDAAGTINAAAWTKESFELATKVAFGPDLTAGDSAEHARALSQRYTEQSAGIADRRVTLASYRLADILRAIFDDGEQ